MPLADPGRMLAGLGQAIFDKIALRSRLLARARPVPKPAGFPPRRHMMPAGTPSQRKDKSRLASSPGQGWPGLDQLKHQARDGVENSGQKQHRQNNEQTDKKNGRPSAGTAIPAVFFGRSSFVLFCVLVFGRVRLSLLRCVLCWKGGGWAWIKCLIGRLQSADSSRTATAADRPASAFCRRTLRRLWVVGGLGKKFLRTSLLKYRGDCHYIHPEYLKNTSDVLRCHCICSFRSLSL